MLQAYPQTAHDWVIDGELCRQQADLGDLPLLRLQGVVGAEMGPGSPTMTGTKLSFYTLEKTN